jgi:hypothetical protein
MKPSRGSHHHTWKQYTHIMDSDGRSCARIFKNLLPVKEGI